ncbi:uncharacterized protein CXorf65 homolog isoform X3 [Lates calcarifer]|uniref:Uncharacterized protein CXorf65 homolog isoform X3 n=1 Tax=Lates calcarifer TaxID=8187 RepID=A0AAJ7PGM9_LATCA|nr:uncharacterized protein CXorf65 homolog isoform X3 [Lates calcarifer]
MFVTILFGDSRMEMFNLNCKLIHFIHHIKKRCGLDFKGEILKCVDLMDSSGSVMNLEVKQHSVDLASSVLEERQCYVLLRVCQLLKKLSNPNKERDRKTRGGRTQRSSPAKQTRSKDISANNTTHHIK